MPNNFEIYIYIYIIYLCAQILFSLTEDVSAAFKRAESLYKNMLRLFPSSPILLRTYSKFVEDLNCDYDTAGMLISWANELEVSKNQVTRN